MTYYICIECGEPCDIISVENYDWEEFWGAPVKRYYTDELTDCCNSEDYDEVGE